MAKFTCTSCDISEYLDWEPDCCSYCMRSMEREGDTDLITPEGSEAAADQATRSDAENGYEASILALWQTGERLSSAMTMTLDEMLVHNRIAMLEAVYREEAA